MNTFAKRSKTSVGGSDVKRSQPAWYFNMVVEEKSAKNRVHLDLMNSDLSAVDDLISLGVPAVSRIDWGIHGWTVMMEPEGNEFCVAAKSCEDTEKR